MGANHGEMVDNNERGEYQLCLSASTWGTVLLLTIIRGVTAGESFTGTFLGMFWSLRGKFVPQVALNVTHG